jgi:hypothetical protein
MSPFRPALATLAAAVATSLIPFVSPDAQTLPAGPTRQVRLATLTPAEERMWAEYDQATAPGAAPAALVLWAERYRVTLRPDGRFDMARPAVQVCNDPPADGTTSVPAQTGCEYKCGSQYMTWVYRYNGYWRGLTCELTTCYWDPLTSRWVCVYLSNCYTQKGDKI